jgi:ribosome-associated protein
MKKNALKRQIAEAIAAAQDKKAENVVALELEKGSGPFTDYFVICNGSNPKQVQAIADGVDERLALHGLHPTHIEGYRQADWVLLDYVDFVVHIFSESARQYYDLERLWKSAKRMDAAQLTGAPPKARRKAPRKIRKPVARRLATRKPATRKPAAKKKRATRKKS